MAKTIEITEPMRNELAEYGPDSAVFKLRGKIHADFKGIIDGTPYVMVGGCVLTPWYGPKVLTALQAEQAS
ncbi:hypothetical protein [Nesterenkonia sp. CF4.4]|uniref:hypothetical protein n=1 Tax=Nesterenkonia sp. CF4.4 TaxID=3373079 RepID=UPI003EE57D8D